MAASLKHHSRAAKSLKNKINRKLMKNFDGWCGGTEEVLQVQNFSANLSFIDLTTFTDHILQVLKTS